MAVVSELPGPSVPAGLSSEEASRRLAANGLNELPPAKRHPIALQFLAELVHFFALMLWVAGLLAWIAGMVQLGVAIFAVVIINAAFSFVQEQRSDHAAQRLRALLPRRVNVRRDGDPVDVDARNVVVGDVLLLSPGDRISADAVVVLDRGARVDVSTLTGESEAISVGLSDRIHAGTFVVDGEAEAEVVATAGDTRLAQISTLTTSTVRPQRPLSRELNRVVRTISIVSVGVGFVFLLVSLALGIGASDGLVFAIGVTVALVPEGLLPTVSLSLAIGAQRMAHHNALVRHLDAVETFGSTTFICTDKTGTLTENRMVVRELWVPTARATIDGQGYGPTATITFAGDDRAALERLVLEATRCGTGRAIEGPDGWQPFGDPMEAALDACARRLGVDVAADRLGRPDLMRYPFDAVRKRMSAVLGVPATTRSGAEIIVKGAVEGILELCLDTEHIDSCHAEATTMAKNGLRLLAVARRATAAGADLPKGAVDAERHLQLIGLIGLLDPPRPAARDALERCRHAGIKVAMVTGDHPQTAFAIAEQVGLSRPGAPLLIGADLPQDPKALAALIDCDGVVVSRATPEHKLRIAEALTLSGHVVAMTGDGVNDGPALRAASIGVAMGRSGTDVAREAADVVLLDDDFATIVEAIAQGRTTFLNVRRFLTYHLTDNVAELTPFLVWALSGGRFPLALSVMQILALDIGTDTGSATALGAEAPSLHVLDGPPVSGRLLNHSVAVRAFALLGPTEALVSMVAFLATFALAGWRPGDSFPKGSTLAAATGAAFLAVVLGQKANAWACRSATVPPWRLGWFGNRLLVYTTIAEVVFASVCLLVRPVADVLDNRFPPALAVVVAALAIPAVWAVDAAYKRAKKRRHR
jgi:magnesium-transporting ATPase (P-type)